MKIMVNRARQVSQRALLIVSTAACLALACAANGEQTMSVAEFNESTGVETEASDSAVKTNPVQRSQKLAASFSGRLLLIPESTNDRVMAFDAVTGDLVDADFIPADPDNLSTPIHAILADDGQSILVSDQLEDAVLEYTLEGDFIGIFAPAGGVDNSILDNVRGIALKGNGNLLVTVGSGVNEDAIAEFDRNGVSLGNFIENGLGGLDSPFDIFERKSDFLVGGIASDDLLSYSKQGAFLSELAAIDNFPEQIATARNGNILVANFSGTQQGIIELSADGESIVGIYDPETLGGYRGVYELPNNNLLVTNGGGVHEISRSGELVETKISGVSARYIEFVSLREETCSAIKLSNGKLALICL